MVWRAERATRRQIVHSGACRVWWRKVCVLMVVSIRWWRCIIWLKQWNGIWTLKARLAVGRGGVFVKHRVGFSLNELSAANHFQFIHFARSALGQWLSVHTFFISIWIIEARHPWHNSLCTITEHFLPYHTQFYPQHKFYATFFLLRPKPSSAQHHHRRIY